MANARDTTAPPRSGSTRPPNPIEVVSKQSQDRRAALAEAIRLKKAAARQRTTGEPSPERSPSTAGQMTPRPSDRPARLGVWQRSLWLLQQLDPTSAAYNLASAYRVEGSVDPERLGDSFRALVARHRLLRSTFHADGDGIRQKIATEPSAWVKTLQLETLQPDPEDGDGAEGLAVREARRPFDLATAPLVRLLVVVEPGSTLLVLVLHHVLADARSLGRLWNELVEGYDELDPLQPSSLPSSEPQYDDYVDWLEARDPASQTLARERDLDFWRQQLATPPDPLELPFERRPGAVRGTEAEPTGRWSSRSLPTAVHDQVRRVAATAEVTPFIVFAFVFRLLLHRTSEGQDLAFATPVSQRSHPATAPMVGYFLNPVLVRTAIDEDQDLATALRDFGTRMRRAMDHGALPFDHLVEALTPPRAEGRHPLFQTMFVYRESPPALELAGRRLDPVELDLGESKFDLTFFATVPSAGFATKALQIAVEYRTERFDAGWMEQLLDHYGVLLGNLETRLRQPVATVSMLDPGELAKLEGWAQGPGLEPLPPREDSPSASVEPDLVPWQILDRARRSADAPALIDRETTWTYARLEAAASRVATALIERGVSPGDRVALFVDRSPPMLVGLVGILWSGAAYVPLDPAYPSTRNRDVLADAEVVVILTGSADNRAALRDLLPDAAPPLLALDELLEMTEPSGDLPLPRADLADDDPIYVVFTSGSTGRPKGVVITQDNLRRSNGARLQVYPMPAGRFLLLPSVAFDSSVAGIYWALVTGGALVIPHDDETRDPRALAELMIERRVTSLLCVPSLWAHLLVAGGDRFVDLEVVIVAGEACSPNLVAEHFRRLPGVRLYNEYGPTEASVWASVYEMEPRDGERPVSIGTPIPGVALEVLDDRSRRVPAGVPGQGWIVGPTLAPGYWRDPERTAERFPIQAIDPGSGNGEQRMYRTGDRLAWADDGRLLFLGRVDDQIKLRGFRIEPAEIEAALLEFPEIEAATVVAREPAQLVAFVEASGIEGLPDRRAELAERLPEFMVPARIVRLDSLPKLPNGKVDRGALGVLPVEPGTVSEPGIVTEEPHATPELPLPAEQEALVALFEGLLGHSGVGPDDNFFQLGGHSLLVVELTTAIEHDLGVRLTPAEVFQHPTVRGLGELIDRRSTPDTPHFDHLFPIQPGGQGNPLVVCVPHFFARPLAERFRGQRPVYGLRGVSLRPEGNYGRWRTMADLGRELVEEVRRRFADRPVVLAGYSFGATMAVEMARQMEADGNPAEKLYLIAPMPVDTYHWGPLRWQLDDLQGPVEAMSPTAALGHWLRTNHPLARRAYQRVWRRLAIQPWRWLLCRAGLRRRRAGLAMTPRILHADVRFERFRLHSQYHPGHVETPTVVFNAEEPSTDAAATWRPFFSGPYTVHNVPDPHRDEVLVESQRQILAHLEGLGR